MAISATRIKQMQSEIKKLKAENARLKKKMRANGGKPAPRTLALPRARISTDENELADEILRRAGLLSEPTEKEKQLVQEWERVSLSERQQLVQEFRNAKLDKPLSEIIIENRR